MRRIPMILALALMTPAGALAQGAVKSTHGPWELRCDTAPGARAEQCVIMQFVTAEDRENVGLTVIVLKTADGQARILRVLAPLGVLLPRGLGLRIDEEDLGSAGFVRCLPNGCVAEVIMDDALIDLVQSGRISSESATMYAQDPKTMDGRLKPKAAAEPAPPNPGFGPPLRR